MSRCSGQCCAGFHIPFSPDDLKKGWRALQDGKQVKGMLVHLRVVPPGGDMPMGTNTSNEDAHIYTCKHHDKKTGDCSIYEQRPAMCRDYPYGKECEWDGCTYANRGKPLGDALGGS